MAGPEQVFAASPIAGAGGRVIASPFQFFVTGEDNLRLTTTVVSQGPALTLSARVVDTKGKINVSRWAHVPVVGFLAVKVQDFTLAPGAVLNVTLAADVNTLYGDIWAKLELIRGTGAAAVVLGTLLQGFPTRTEPLTWPGSVPLNTWEAQPIPFDTGFANPAAGGGFVWTQANGLRRRVLSFTGVFTTTAAAGLRRLYCGYRNGGVYLWKVEASVDIGPGVAKEFCFAEGLSGVTAGAGSMVNQAIPPGVWMQPSTDLVVWSSFFDVGDQMSQLAASSLLKMETT